MNRYYITPEEYEIAESNGISRQAVNDRVRGYAWDVEKAIETPMIRRTDAEWIKLAESNGISYYTYWMRVKRGMDKEKAAITEVKSRKEIMKFAVESRTRTFTDEMLEFALSIGVSYNTIMTRRSRGWSVDASYRTPLRIRKNKAYGKACWE